MSKLIRRCLLVVLAFAPLVAVAQPAEPPPTPPAPPDEPVPPTAPTAPAPVVVEPTPAPVPEPKVEKTEEKKKDPPWYDKLAIRGYVQVRFNRLYASDDDFKNDLGDKAIAKNNSFSIRRARLVVQGDVAPFLFMYLQVDASGADVKMRDWYGDFSIDKDKELRFRLGQSKVPYGWENMQSSQNRAPLDRSDPINSAVPGERDIGLFAYWAPKKTRKMFKHLVDSGLKGSGDYGVLALGIYNGQTLNVDDKNENRHVVARATYPIEIGTQILEIGANAYVGKFTVERDETVFGKANTRDARVGAAVVLYPQPIGFQAEWNVGTGPELVDDTIEATTLHGGYAMVNARVGDFFPFLRGAYYEGGLKTAKNAPLHRSKELAAGVEWHYKKRFEVTAEIDRAKREIADGSVTGTIFRLQGQFNY
ncbi:MAG: porin [Deltaproteobacteria bacterium]|nr:porin [Deltaproteobacteria bacterium]